MENKHSYSHLYNTNVYNTVIHGLVAMLQLFFQKIDFDSHKHDLVLLYLLLQKQLQYYYESKENLLFLFGVSTNRKQYSWNMVQANTYAILHWSPLPTPVKNDSHHMVCYTFICNKVGLIWPCWYSPKFCYTNASVYYDQCLSITITFSILFPQCFLVNYAMWQEWLCYVSFLAHHVRNVWDFRKFSQFVSDCVDTA